MQAIARAVGFNETAFVLPSTRADLRLRYFTPGHEVDLCGHATIGSFVALYEHGLLAGEGLPRQLTMETGAGLLRVSLEAGAAGPVVIMEQAPARFAAFHGDRPASQPSTAIAPRSLEYSVSARTTSIPGCPLSTAAPGCGLSWCPCAPSMPSGG
jgi:PhzF family phenazine biosynthesis protein